MTETTTTLDLSLLFGESEHTLRELKKSIDSFFDTYQVPAEMIEAIRQQIATEHLNPSHYCEPEDDGTMTGCIIGLYATLTYPNDLVARDQFLRTCRWYDVEYFMIDASIESGYTPETSPAVAQLDAVLALCQEERA